MNVFLLGLIVIRDRNDFCHNTQKKRMEKLRVRSFEQLFAKNASTRE